MAISKNKKRERKRRKIFVFHMSKKRWKREVAMPPTKRKEEPKE